MYQVGGWLEHVRGHRHRSASSAAISFNVILLGLTSLLTDISSEMVVSVLPLYLISFLHLSPMQFGLVDGLYQGAAAFVQLAAGMVSDRGGRYKEIAGLGYAVSAVTRVGFLITTAWTGIAGLLALDRVGKGLRTAPRDALISLSADPQQLGLAFGIHRAMDAMGAMLGPVIAFLLLSRIPDRFDVVFVVSLCAAIAGLAVFALLVVNPERVATQARTSVALDDAVVLWRDRRFRHLSAAAFVLGAATISDAFVYLTLQRLGQVTPGVFPLLFVATSGCYLLTAVPIGRLADRRGRFPVFLAGHVLLVALYLILALQPSAWLAVLSVVILGLYYAASEGVLMGLGSGVVAVEMRATGLGVLSTALGVGRLIGSIAFGFFWNTFGLTASLIVFAIALSVALTFVVGTRPRSAQ